MNKKRPYSQDQAAWFKRERLEADKRVVEFERRAKEHPFLCADEAWFTTQAVLRYLEDSGAKQYGVDVKKDSPLILGAALAVGEDGRTPLGGSLGACAVAGFFVDHYMSYTMCFAAMEKAYRRPDIWGVRLARCVCELYATLRRDEPRSIFTALETVQERFPQASRREALAEALTGYFDSQLNTSPEKRLGRALLDEKQKLTDVLPAEALAVWADRGYDELNALRNRISLNLQQLGRESTFKEKVTDAAGVLPDSGRDEILLEEFEREHALRQQLAALQTWTEQAHLSEQQKQVRELDMSTNYDTGAIASELGITTAHVRKVRHDYVEKIRKAADL